MTTPITTSTIDSQMHNSIMTAGSMDHPPMLATGRYAQWRSRFLRYIDTKTNGDALRKCILEGPYIPSTVLIQAVPAIENSPAVPEHTTVETILNMSPANKAHFESEKEAIHRILTGIGDEIYSTIDACNTAHEISNETTRHKGKEIAKPITPPFESASDEDNDPEQAQKDKEIQKNLALIVKYFKKLYKPTNNNLRTSSNTRNKNVDTTPRYKNNNQSRQFGNQRTMTIAGARETVRIIKSVDYVILCYLVISLSFVNVNVVCNKKLVNTSRAKKLEKSHDPLALVAHTSSSSRQTSSYYVTHPTSMVDYDDEYQQDDVHNNSEDPLVSAIIRIYNGAEDTIKFQDNWSSSAMANVMQDILQMLDNTCHWMGSTAIADNEDTKQVGYADTSLDESLMKMSKEELSDVAEVFGDRCSSDLFLKSRKQEKCGTWLMSTLASEEIEREPRRNKESLEVEITKDKEVEITKETLVVEITNVVIPVNVNDDDEEITDEVYELKRREKGKLVEETRNSPIPTPIRSPRIHTNLVSSDTEKLQELTNTHTTSSSRQNLLASNATRASFRSYKDVMVTCFYTSMARFIARQSFDTPVIIFSSESSSSVCWGWVILERQRAKRRDKSLIAKPDPQLQQQDIAIWLALQMKFKRNTVPQIACRTLAVRPRDQDDPHDDAPPEGENSAKRQKTSEYEAHVTEESSEQVNEREQSLSSLGNQKQVDDYDFWTESYASDDDEIPTKQVLQDIIEEVSLTINEAELKKITDEICQRDPEAPALSLINQDLLYLKKGNSRPEKIVLSLHKFPAIIFNDVNVEERTSRWRQKEPGKPKEVVYSNSEIIQVIKTYWELGHEHKFITEIVSRRANECIMSITEPDYKNLNKNDIC
ncbi:hypothetical protein Tco_1292474 [Tanacetum coccineum]